MGVREIKFRGKDIHGIWHIGLLAHMRNAWYISNKAGIATAYEVIPDTIGQFTGLYDKNGEMIFEGDNIKSCEFDDVYTVKYFANNGYPAFDCDPDVPVNECNGLSFLVSVEGCEICGNIYDDNHKL